jgi:hypothetical protein
MVLTGSHMAGVISNRMTFVGSSMADIAENNPASL